MTARRTTPREHGTRARYCFGPFGNDRANGCRCDACREANNAYARFSQKRVRLNRDHGAWARPYVPTGAALRHIDLLRSQGIGYRQVAHLAGVATSQVGDIISGRSSRIRRETEAKILAVSAEPAGAALVDAAPTWVLVNRLLAAGVTKCRIGQAVTGNPNAKSLQLHSSKVLWRSHRAVVALHWDILGDPDDPDRSDTRRFNIAPLLAEAARQGVSKLELIKRTGINLHRARRAGHVNADQADRLAVEVGRHPAEIWPDYGQVDKTGVAA